MKKTTMTRTQQNLDQQQGKHLNTSFAVYSTYCGSNKNKTFNPTPVPQSIPHFFLSNNTEVMQSAAEVGWIPILLNLEISEHPVVSAHQAKIAKAVPHLFDALKDYDYLFYKDDKLDINIDSLTKALREFQSSNWALAIRPHPFLTGNILKEFSEAMLQRRYYAQRDMMVDYIMDRLKENYSLNCQMYWTSAILRNMKHPDAIAINNMWYQHIQNCGIECQVSFNFIAQKFQSIKLLPIDL